MASPTPRFEPPDPAPTTGIALRSAELLLGIVIGATSVFVLFGIFGMNSPGLLPSPAPDPTARPTFSVSSTPRATPVPPTPVPTASPTPVPTPVPTPSPTPVPTPVVTFPPIATATPSDSVAAADTLAGTWSVVAGSSAGYRITLHLPIVGASQVSGRTEAMTGQVVIESRNGTDVMTSAHFSGDLRQLKSSNALLDRQVSTLLKTDQYPTSDFDLLDPVVMPSVASLGTPQPIVLHGQLTLQGTSHPFDMPASAQLVNGQLVIAGGVDFKLSQFGIATNVGGVATVDDDARFEFQLVLAR